MSTPHPRLWHTADRSALVEDGDPRAAFLAYSGFDEVPDGVTVEGAAASPGSSMSEPPAEREPTEVKKAPAPADKRGTRPADKTRTRATK